MTDDYTYDCDCGVHVINDYGQDHECQWRPFAVYGTLRPGCGNDRLWQGNAAPIGLGHVTGFRLVSNGAFPYAVPTEDQRIVVEMVMPHVGRYADILWRMTPWKACLTTTPGSVSPSPTAARRLSAGCTCRSTTSAACRPCPEATGSNVTPTPGTRTNLCAVL